MWAILKPLFFLFSAERAHYLSMQLLSMALHIPILSSWIRHSFTAANAVLPVSFAGLVCKNKLGLAAGFDKDGRWLHLLSILGFGHIEVGTVTPKAQVGNPKPRLFRLVEDRSIINRMGFNNEGVDALAERLRKFKKPEGLIIGGNIGKNKITPAENAVDDYVYCFISLFDVVDYFTINVSSPNTPGLRALQDKEPLDLLLRSIQKVNLSQGKPKPVFLKIAPDLNDDAIVDIVEVISKNSLTGIIISNTTIDRPATLQSENKSESGGLSGAALTEKADKIMQLFRKLLGKEFIIIGVGGIMNESDAIERIRHGADFIQIYSGMIYEGPWMVKKILNRLAKF